MGGYYVAVEITCDKQEHLALWHRISKIGDYKFTETNEKVLVYGRHKTPENLQALYEIVENYPDHSVKVEHDA